MEACIGINHQKSYRSRQWTWKHSLYMFLWVPWPKSYHTCPVREPSLNTIHDSWMNELLNREAARDISLDLTGLWLLECLWSSRNTFPCAILVLPEWQWLRSEWSDWPKWIGTHSTLTKMRTPLCLKRHLFIFTTEKLSKTNEDMLEKNSPSP